MSDSIADRFAKLRSIRDSSVQERRELAESF
jgi:hypothetical protein